MKRILMIVGSMRKESFNKKLALLAKELISDRAEVSFLEYKDIPPMNQDIEYPAPEEIERVRREVKSADGIWFMTAEYNYSYPGVLKNLLDWLSPMPISIICIMPMSLKKSIFMKRISRLGMGELDYVCSWDRLCLMSSIRSTGSRSIFPLLIRLSST